MAAAFTLFLSCLVFAAATSCHAVADIEEPDQIHLLLPSSGASENQAKRVNCQSWRLGVETHNIRDWDVVPSHCAAYIAKYMARSKQYALDCESVADVAIQYAKSTPIPRDGRTVWVFDVSETALSNLEYYARPSVAFGAKKYNSTAFGEYILTANVPALPATLRLYKTVVGLGIKAVFISGSSEIYREARETNLKKVGYGQWEMLVLKPKSERGKGGVYFKSLVRTKLVEAGYRILGNVGDQWSDLLGENPGRRTFKMPNPMYYVG